MQPPCTIRPARAEDRDAILAVMRPWNMHHVPSPEMQSLHLDCFFGSSLRSRGSYARLGSGGRRPPTVSMASAISASAEWKP